MKIQKANKKRLELAYRVVEWRRTLTIGKMLEIKKDISAEAICDADLFQLGSVRALDSFFGKNKKLKERLKLPF